MKNVSTKGLWHVNDNGVVTQCRAENGGCPFAHNGHYATRIDAERMAEEILSGGAEAKTLKNEPSAADAAVSLDDKPAVFNVFKMVVLIRPSGMRPNGLRTWRSSLIAYGMAS